MDGERLASGLASLGGCAPLSGQCQVTEGTVIWNGTQLLGARCPFVWKGHYRGEISGTHLKIDGLQLAFTIGGTVKAHPLYKYQRCLPMRGYLTAQGHTMVVLSYAGQNGTVPFLIAQAKQAFENREIFLSQNANYSGSDPANAKYQYLLERIQTDDRKNFAFVWHSMCKMADSLLSHTHQLLRLDPTLGARALLLRNNISADFAGEALIIRGCHRVTPNQVYWNGSYDGRCYKYVPVEVNGTLWFLSPGSRDLTHEGVEIPCDHHTLPLFKEKGKWRTTKGEIHVQGVRVELIWDGKWSSFSFSAPPLIDWIKHGAASSLLLLQSLFPTFISLSGKMDRMVAYQAVLSNNPNGVSAYLEGVDSTIHNGTSGVLTFIGHGLESVLGGLGNLLKIPFQFIGEVF
jgi:hypothetical protein